MKKHPSLNSMLKVMGGVALFSSIFAINAHADTTQKVSTNFAQPKTNNGVTTNQVLNQNNGNSNGTTAQNGALIFVNSSDNSNNTSKTSKGYLPKWTNAYATPDDLTPIVTSIEHNLLVKVYDNSEVNGRTKVAYGNHTYYVSTRDIIRTPQRYSDDYGISHYTRYDMENMLRAKNNSRYRMPKIDAKKIRNVTSAKDDMNHRFRGQQLDVWDSWPIKGANGQVIKIHGYYVVFALSGNANQKVANGLAGKICMYYQKAKDHKKGVSSWHYAGPVFKNRLEGAVNKNDSTLRHETGEWSGSALMQKNGKIRLMYTSFSGDAAFGGFGDNRQTLTTAQIAIKKTKNGLAIDHRHNSGRQPLFEGDGKYYETAEETTDLVGFTKDDHTLRDPQLFTANGHTYVLFEGNTSSQDGPYGSDALNNDAFYGGDANFKNQQYQLFKNNPTIETYNGREHIKGAAGYANGCLGLLELNDNYTIKKVLPPLVAFNLVDDETERPSIVRHNGRWYIFTAMHGWHMASVNSKPNDSFMLGFSSSELTGNYKPLNGNGLVFYDNANINSRKYTYSYSMNQSNKNPFILTSYMTKIASNNGKNVKDHATFAPSVQVELKGNTSRVLPKTLSQGQIVK